MAPKRRRSPSSPKSKKLKHKMHRKTHLKGGANPHLTLEVYLGISEATKRFEHAFVDVKEAQVAAEEYVKSFLSDDAKQGVELALTSDEPGDINPDDVPQKGELYIPNATRNGMEPPLCDFILAKYLIFEN